MTYFDRQPLPLDTFPAQLQKMVFGPGAPPPMKLMAARGMSPGAPPELGLSILYQLQFDSDELTQQAALESLMEMPAEILTPQLHIPQPEAVLDWVAEVRKKDAEILQSIILKAQTHDQTIASIAGHANARLCDVIAQNEVRILRSPSILEALYKNPNARMATVDRLVDLAKRNSVVLDGLPGLQAVLESGQDLALDDASQMDESAFASFIKEDVERGDEEPAEEDANKESMTRREREDAEKREQEALPKGPVANQIMNMNIAQKVRTATIGSREAIMILVREPNRLVHMAAINSPRLQYNDMKKMSANKSMPDGVIRFIAMSREWSSKPEIMVNLVNNPKTPIQESLKFLNHLRLNDLRTVLRNRNIPRQVSRMAKELLNKRQG